MMASVHPSPPGHDDAVQALMLASRAFVGLAAQSLSTVDDDVTLAQFRTLVVLAAQGPQRSIDIAAELRTNPSTTTRMCDRLVRKGLIRRTRSSRDRRVVQLRLSPLGQQIVEQVMEHRRAELIRLVQATADRWTPEVSAALRAFAAAVGERPEQEWWLGWSARHHDGPAADGAGEPNDDAGEWPVGPDPQRA
jgi:DNA-binding MarR family transcriptional regulator